MVRPPKNKRKPWKTLKTRLAYDNPWIRIREDKVINPSGNPGIYGVIHYKNLALGIVPIDDKGYTYLVGQYRYPLKEYSWEIPEGGGKLNINPLVSAKRELREETGIRAKYWKRILVMHLSNSTSDERAEIYLATGLSYGEDDPEDDEDLVVKKVKLSEAARMAERGQITDAMSVAGLLRARQILAK